MVQNQAVAEAYVPIMIVFSIALMVISIVMWKMRPSGKEDMKRSYAVLIFILGIFLLASTFALSTKVY